MSTIHRRQTLIGKILHPSDRPVIKGLIYIVSYDISHRVQIAVDTDMSSIYNIILQKPSVKFDWKIG